MPAKNLQQGRHTIKMDNSDWVQKPRTLYWEYLFLSENSQLRQFLSSFEISETLNPFDLIEDTVFVQTPTQQFQEKILPSSNPVEVGNYKSLGAYIALFSWFGVTDLHKDNLIYKTVNNKVKIIPIDIECIFNDIHLPSETYLIPRSSELNPKVGLHKTIEALQKSESVNHCVDVISGYVEYLNFLDTIRKKISTLIFGLDGIYDIPIRSIVRDSTFYNEFMDKEELPKSELDKSEILQLKKKKVPYYFHYLRDHKIYYYRSPYETSSVSQSSELYSKIHKATRRQGVIPSREAYANLLEAGALQLAEVLIPKSYIGELESGPIKITCTEKAMNINFQGHFNVECEK